MRLNEDVNGEIYMYAYCNKNSQRPNLLYKKRNIFDPVDSLYYDAKRFRDDSSETKVLFGCEEINSAFFRTAQERTAFPNKYNQYVSVPVFCKNSKMIGLLQVAFLEGCSIADDKELLKELADQLIVPYSHLFLLLHKTDKVLNYKFNMKEEKNESNNKKKK